jgi:hypothetical protein
MVVDAEEKRRHPEQCIVGRWTLMRNLTRRFVLLGQRKACSQYPWVLSEHFRPVLTGNWHPLAVKSTVNHDKRLLRTVDGHDGGLEEVQDGRKLKERRQI